MQKDLQDSRVQLQSIINQSQLALRDAEAHHNLKIHQKEEELEIKVMNERRQLSEISTLEIGKAKSKAYKVIKDAS